MKILEIMKKRASYRKKFTDRCLTIEEIKYIVEAGFEAPSGCNLQTPRFIGVTDKDKVEKISEIYGHDWAKTSTACIVIITKPMTLGDKYRSYHLEDFGAAAQNVLLAISELGFASTWIQGQIEGEKAEKIAELLNVPEDYMVIGYFPVGEPEEEVVHARKKESFEERCFLNGYGEKF